MMDDQIKEKILKVAADLDNDLEKMNIDTLLTYFSKDCEIEMLGITLTGISGVRKWLSWFFKSFSTIKFEPIIIMVEGDVFFEEFYIHGVTQNNKKLTGKIAEILVYENYKIKNLRLYFDRLNFADASITGFLEKKIVNFIKNKSLKDLK
jgi:ketosteroid isomerase-like protein